MSILRKYPATIVRIIDGDTLVLRVDVGFRNSYEDTFRLAHCNAAEGKYTEAAKKLREWLPIGKSVTVTSSKPEKFGRWLCDISWEDCESLVENLISCGLATSYEGGKR